MKDSIFSVHKSNLDYARAIVIQEGVAYLHGDGNIYDNKEASDFRKDFSNPKNTAAQHRVIFRSVSQIPTTLDELEKLFYAQKQLENKESRQMESTGAAKVKTISLENQSAKPAGAGKSQSQLDEEQLQLEIEEEERKAKAAAGGAQ